MSNASPPCPPPLTSATGWQLRLLGRFQLDNGLSAAGPLGGRAARLLLVRLALAPERDHAREELATLLWPEADAVGGRNRLRQALSLLKAVLEPPGSAAVLLADRRVLRVAPNALWCDVPTFEQACRAGQPALARELYKGELLPGFKDEWVVDERQRLAQLHRQLGDGANPPGLAARKYAPPARMPQPAPAAALPSYLTRLMGADLAGRRLRALVAEQRLVTVTGPGGVGKTRLAVEVAHSLCSGGAAGAPRLQGVTFVPAVMAVDAAQLLQRLPAPAGQPMLLVLDNCEQLDDGAVQALARRIEGQPGVHWLLTSRRPLGLDGEHCLRLEPLPLPAPGTPTAELAMNPAVALFCDRARAHRPDFLLHALQPAQQAALIELLHWLEGLPLALELAALHMHTLDPAGLLGLLRSALDDPAVPAAGLRFLARRGVRGGSDPRHASMLDVADWSWRLLNPAQQALLTQLCLQLPDGATHEQAAALAGAGAGTARAQEELDELVAHSVLRLQLGPDGVSRYRAFALVQEFVRARWVAGGPEAAPGLTP